MLTTIFITVLTNALGLLINAVLVVKICEAWLKTTPPSLFQKIYNALVALEESIPDMSFWDITLSILAFVAIFYVLSTVFFFVRRLMVDPDDCETRDGTEYTITKSCTGEYSVESKATYSGGGGAMLWNVILFVISWVLLTCFGAVLSLFLLLFKRFRTMTFEKFYSYND